MDQMNSAGFEHMKHTPLYAAYAEAMAESVDHERGITDVEAEDQRQAI